MASVPGIVNSALAKIGATRITALTDGTRNAQVASDIYDVVRDDMLRGHNWNFATQRVQLARSANAPAFGFDYQYPVPADFLRVVSVHDNDAGTGDVAYKVEHSDDDDATVILTDATEVWLRYVAAVTDPNRMSADFREALAYALAENMAIPIASSNTLREQMAKERQRAIAKAKSADGQEDYPEQFPESSWVTARGGARRSRPTG